MTEAEEYILELQSQIVYLKERLVQKEQEVLTLQEQMKDSELNDK